MIGHTQKELSEKSAMKIIKSAAICLLIGLGPSFGMAQHDHDEDELDDRGETASIASVTFGGVAMVQAIAAQHDPPQADPPAHAMVGEGCDRCRQTGYSGRIGIFEMLSMTQPMRALVTGETEATDLRETAIAEASRRRPSSSPRAPSRPRGSCSRAGSATAPSGATSNATPASAWPEPST